jgi:hypothetical protein
MHNTPIGPTGAAIEKPMMSPLSRKEMSMFFSRYLSTFSCPLFGPPFPGFQTL